MPARKLRLQKAGGRGPEQAPEGIAKDAFSLFLPDITYAGIVTSGVKGLGQFHHCAQANVINGGLGDDLLGDGTKRTNPAQPGLVKKIAF